MNECLVTRLKSSVNDDNLNIFGATSLKIKTDTDVNSKFGIITADEPIILKWNTEKVEIKMNDVILSSPYTFSNYNGSETLFFVMNKTKEIQTLNVLNFENIISFNTKLVANYTCPFNQPFDLNVFNDSRYLTYVSLTNINCKGDISIFERYKSIYYLDLCGLEVIGDISNLPVGVLSYVFLFNTSITGSLESYVQKCRQNGKPSGQISLGYIHPTLNKITFNGTVPRIFEEETAAKKNVLSWTETTITLGDVTINA